VLRVGVALEAKGTVTVNDNGSEAALFWLSETITERGKFCSGCASTEVIIRIETGLVGIKEPGSTSTCTWESLGGPETFMNNCGTGTGLLVNIT
jgi:hypothetical protein